MPRTSGRDALNGMCCAAPILLSLMALALVVQGVALYDGHLLAGGGETRLFLILMIVQLPLIALFAGTADWRSRTRPLRILGLQTFGWIAVAAAAGLSQWLAL